MTDVRFGNYRVEEVLGSGALSTIYKAVQEPASRVVALKVLKSQIGATSSFGEQLEREARILGELAHPNVILLLDSGRGEGGRPYVVLEYVDGPSLQQVLQKRRKLDVATALAIAIELCAGLEHVHERGVVHRDVKPSNVLLARSGVVKLVDFGISHRLRTPNLSDPFGAEGITPSGRMAPDAVKDAFGTPAYMSPEQILGDFESERSDLFSLGVVLYQMLAGGRPFEAHVATPKPSPSPLSAMPGSRASRPPPNERHALQRMRRDVAAPLRDRAPDVPRAVERIVMRLLEKAPDDRYPSATVVLERLTTALRAITRDDPKALVREALVRTGFIKAPRTKASSLTDAGPRPMGLARALLGYGALLVVFLGGIAAVEAASPGRDGGRNAGAEVLPLVPDRAGGLRVLATPWAHVKVDGQDLETTPFARAIPLAAGKHYVTLTHPEALPVDREVDIVAGETVTLDVTMELFASDAGAPPVTPIAPGASASITPASSSSAKATGSKGSR